MQALDAIEAVFDHQVWNRALDEEAAVIAHRTMSLTCAAPGVRKGVPAAVFDDLLARWVQRPAFAEEIDRGLGPDFVAYVSRIVSLVAGGRLESPRDANSLRAVRGWVRRWPDDRLDSGWMLEQLDKQLGDAGDDGL